MNGGDDYTVSVPAGAFKINNGESKAFTDKLDVQAHPVYAVTARPYTFDKDGEVKTLVLDGIVTLDDLIEGNADEDKYFEKDLRKYLKDRHNRHPSGAGTCPVWNDNTGSFFL